METVFNSIVSLILIVLSEVETVFNSIVSLILIVPLDQSEKLVVSFCEKLVKTQSGDKRNSIRMRM